MHRSKWYRRLQSLALQVLAVGLIADLVNSCLWSSPAAATGLALGATIGIGNVLAWQRGVEPTEMA